MRRVLLGVASAFVLSTQGCADSQTSELEVSLAMQPHVLSQDAVLAQVTITNVSDHDVRMLSWTLPDGDLQEPLFQLMRDGQPVRYIGNVYKRAQPDASDYVTIVPGASLVRSVDLAKFYDVSASGNYTIELDLDQSVSSVGSMIEGRKPVVVSSARPTRDSCSADQHALINAALPVALSYSAGARDYLGGSPNASQRYVAWFGAFSSAGWNTAAAHFASIANAFATQTFSFDCSCKQKNVYAFVNPNVPYNITVCGAFWSAPTSGTDSKAGTLVHETSHFTVTASTNDWAYGKTACTSLAQTDPTKALDNADSHEYFAENNPQPP